jgi:hypothetical protein
VISLHPSLSNPIAPHTPSFQFLQRNKQTQSKHEHQAGILEKNPSSSNEYPGNKTKARNSLMMGWWVFTNLHTFLSCSSSHRSSSSSRSDDLSFLNVLLVQTHMLLQILWCRNTLNLHFLSTETKYTTHSFCKQQQTHIPKKTQSSFSLYRNKVHNPFIL